MGLRFEHPLAFFLLGLFLLGSYLQKRNHFPAQNLASFPSIKKIPASFRQRLLPLLPLLEALAVVAIVAALARPYLLQEVPDRHQGIDIMLCLDTSSSMRAKDMDPKKTRLDIAKDAAKKFTKDRRSDRIGLLRFARYPDLLCPPTLDHFALGLWIDRMEVVRPDGDEDLTGIGVALARAALILSRNRGSQAKVIILLTDGRETVAVPGESSQINPAHAALLCKQYGIRVHTIAIGRKKEGKGYNRKPYNLPMLRNIAESSGGATFEAGNPQALAAVYSRIDRLETSERETPLYERSERFRLFLLAGILFLAARILLGTTYLEVQR